MIKTNFKLKHTIALALFFILNAHALFAQNLDSCGIDNNPTLSKDEALALNDYFKDQKGDFDFQNKKIAIIRGSAGSGIGSKQHYFRDIRSWKQQNNRIASRLIVLNEEEKLQSGGYDALLTHWVMAHISERKKKKFVKKLPTYKW
jgi:hypothetical protein